MTSSGGGRIESRRGSPPLSPLTSPFLLLLPQICEELRRGSIEFLAVEGAWVPLDPPLDPPLVTREAWIWCAGEVEENHQPRKKSHIVSSLGTSRMGALPLLAVGCKWYRYFMIVFEFDLSWKDFYLSISDFGYSIFVTYQYPSTKKWHFYNVNIHYNFIRQKVTLSISNSVFQ